MASFHLMHWMGSNELLIVKNLTLYIKTAPTNNSCGKLNHEHNFIL